MQEELLFSELRPSPLNPRKHARSEQGLEQLAASIVDYGVLHPILARQTPTGLEIVAGEGRYRAVAKLIEEGRVKPDFKLPVSVRDLNDEQAIELALIENLQREDLHPLDEAQAFAALYDMKAKSGGKKAAAGAVKFLADRMHRTTRYVQKRIKIARDLIPEWLQLLEEDVLKVHIAQLLSSMPAKEQRDELAKLTDYGTRPLDKDKVRGLTAADFADDWRPLSAALFEVALYDGETEDVDGEIYAIDREAFDALQKQAAADLTKEMRAKARAEEIEFFETGLHFNPSLYEAQKPGVEPDPAGGVYLEKGYDDKFRVFRGLFKTKVTLKVEEERKEQKAERVKRAKKETAKRGKEAAVEPKPDDPRIDQVWKFMLANPGTRLAVEIFATLSERNQLSFYQGEWIGHEQKNTARALLREIHDGALPTNGKLLTWLLTLKSSQLLAPFVALMRDDGLSIEQLIEKPSAAEQVLFEHCKATLPDELKPKPAAKKPDAKPKTASKSKPSKKGKKK